MRPFIVPLATVMLTAATVAAGLCDTGFAPINGSLCISSQFVKKLDNVTSEEQCTILCGFRPQCQAFSLSDGPCQLFEFNKCSKSVRDCGCSRRGRVFVRQQPGLPPGQLCPSGYGDDLCGVKYKAYEEADVSFEMSRQKCESESGLVIMADVTSAVEKNHVLSVRSLRAGDNTMWLGGFQAPRSAEPGGGWYWVDCNIPVDSSLWARGEPDDSGNGQDTIAAYSGKDGLTDFTSAVSFGLCECLSPFE